MNGSYRVLLARGQTRHLIAGLGAAWLSFGMVGLATFLTTHRATGSYGVAGGAVAAFSLGSGALAPLRGRLLDRRGAQPWLLVFAAGYAIGLLALSGLSQRNAPTWALILCAAVSGVSAPPLVASFRALWPSVVEEPLIRRAYALTSVIGDVGLVIAPALAGLLFVAVPWLPLVVCALSAMAAALVVVRTEQRLPDQGAATGALPLLTQGFVVLLVVEIALGVALGLIEVAVPTAASSWGTTAYSGFLLASFACGSVVGGIWFGRRHWKAAPERRYLIATLLLALGLLPLVTATSPANLAPLLFLAGLAFGPATISLFEALDNLATSRATEAFTWLTTSGAIGTALGSAAAGWATTTIGLSAAFAAVSATLGIAAACGLAQSTAFSKREETRNRRELTNPPRPESPLK